MRIEVSYVGIQRVDPVTTPPNPGRLSKNLELR